MNLTTDSLAIKVKDKGKRYRIINSLLNKRNLQQRIGKLPDPRWWVRDSFFASPEVAENVNKYQLA
ncbi:hypothetical protein HMPREF3226_02849 [Prevotella corporis]|uniref:Uncharacterized protein n=1 Tax=Prevotella corporis TaxID=28128 RepID=A0A133PT06_9BACT|nr:hypothetical protein HMPREF3226_02849 [Prevotella corporis]